MSRQHTVRPGECLATIAERYGHHPDTIWDDPNNEELRESRRDGQALGVGDVIHVPALRDRTEDCATDQVHRFKRKSIPIPYRFRIVADGEPRANLDVIVRVESTETPARTDGDGCVEGWLPKHADEVTVVVETDDWIEEHVFALGHLDPVETLSGVRQRLTNLGYLRAGQDDLVYLHRAIRSFRIDRDLTISWDIDDELEDELVEVHGG